MKKKYLAIFILTSLLAVSFLIYKFTLNNFFGRTDGNVQFLKELVPKPVKNFLKKTIFKNEYLLKESEFNEKLIKKIHNDNVSIYQKKLYLIETLDIQSLNNQSYQLKKFSFPS